MHDEAALFFSKSILHKDFHGSVQEKTSNAY